MSSRTVIFAFLGLLALGALLQVVHPLAQPAAYHHFADVRPLGPISNAANVLSNITIVLAGVINLSWIARHSKTISTQLPGMLIASVGLVLTAAGSAYYHWAPSDATLIWDRLPMTIVFAGILVMLWVSMHGRAPGWTQALWFTAGSAATVLYWAILDSLWPYVLLQFGGIVAVVVATALRKVDRPRAWAIMIGWYVLAKVFELLDVQVLVWTGGLCSGHAIKHVASGLTGLALIRIASAAGLHARRDVTTGHDG